MRLAVEFVSAHPGYWAEIVRSIFSKVIVVTSPVMVREKCILLSARQREAQGARDPLGRELALNRRGPQPLEGRPRVVDTGREARRQPAPELGSRDHFAF